jgi:phosphoenolpyruvate synthase/pyruvate phosphate dikinase
MIVFASMLSVWLDYRKRGMMKQFYYIFSILHEFSKRKNIPYLTLNNMTVDEFLNFIKTGKGIDPKEIERRKEALITVHTKGNKTKIIYGEDAVKIFESSKHKISEGQEIKGSIASMGKEKTVRGVARIVIDPSKDEFNDGEILVASMTRIEFVPLMKKASAIVTDEGGIACHAAIVSRELGVPCIIGTKIATRMLHNGDKIELDLTKGTVKVLSD